MITFKGTPKKKEWEKKTGYKMANRQVGYKGKKHDTKCFQRQLREQYPEAPIIPLENMRVLRIPFRKAQEFILDYEWLGTMGTTKVSFGLFCNLKLVGVACFGLTAGTGSLAEPFGEEWKDKGLVLVRGACAHNAHPHAGSYLIGQAKKLLAARGYLFAIAYSDPEAGEIGTLYQATNWNFYGFTSPINYLIRPDGKRVDPKLIHKYAKKFGISSQAQKEKFLAEGYTFEKAGRKLKYLMTFGNRKDVHTMMKNKKVEFHPYLKRDTGMANLYDNWKSRDLTIDC